MSRQPSPKSKNVIIKNSLEDRLLYTIHKREVDVKMIISGMVYIYRPNLIVLKASLKSETKTKIIFWLSASLITFAISCQKNGILI